MDRITNCEQKNKKELSLSTMASLSLCSTFTAKPKSFQQSQKQISALSTSNVNFLSHSLSSLKLTSSPSSFSFVPKFSATETAPALSEPESESQVLETSIQELPKREEVFAVVMVSH